MRRITSRLPTAVALTALVAAGAGCAATAPARRPAAAPKPSPAPSAPRPAAPARTPEAKAAPPSAPARPAAPQEGPAARFLRELVLNATPDLKAAFTREAAPVPVRPFRTPAGFEGTVPARQAPAVSVDDGYETVTADVGATEPLSCFVHAERLDAASSYLALLGSFVEGSGVEVIAAELAEVSAVKGSPLLVFHVVYAASRDGRRATGLVKIGILPHDLHSVACLHDEPGHVETFRRSVAALAGSLRHPTRRAPRDTARFADLQIARIQGRPAGFQEQHLTKHADGSRTLVNVSTQIFNRSPKDLVGTDDQDVTVAAPDGTLVSRLSVEVEGGELAERMKLERQGRTLAYVYSGTMSGKKLEGRFEAGSPLWTDVLLARRFARTGGNTPPAELRVLEWIPSVDPRAASEVVYRGDPARPGAVVAELGTFRILARLDTFGWLERSQVNLGPFTVVQERVWSRGAP